MSFLDNLGQWSKSDTKKQRANPTKTNFPTVNRKIRKKKGYVDIHLFINKRLSVALATKYRLK